MTQSVYPFLLTISIALLAVLSTTTEEAYILKDLLCISLPALCPSSLIHVNKGLPLEVMDSNAKDCPFCALASSPSSTGKNRLVYQVISGL